MMSLSQILLPIIFLGAPLGIILMQLLAYLRDRALKRNGKFTRGKVISRGSAVDELEGQEYLATSKTRRISTVQFYTEDGKEWFFDEDLGLRAEKYPLHTPIHVYYDPKDPTLHVVGAGVRLRSVIWFFLLSLPVLGAGIWIAFSST